MISQMSVVFQCMHGTRMCWTKKTHILPFRDTSTCEKRHKTQLLTGATLSSSVGFVTPLTEILAVRCK